MSIEIRKIKIEDEGKLIDICFVTGDAFLKKVFPDKYLFSLFWCLYYVWYESENSFVAIDDENNKVIGYIFSTLNTKFQERNFKKTMRKKIWNRINELNIHSLRTKIITFYLLNKPSTIKRNKILKNYPAHLHINILPKYQRQGIGWKLMKTLESHLKEEKILGYHLEVGAHNEVGLNFYQKYNLELLKETNRSKFFGRRLY